ncbi:MAG: hypothetical protein COW24_01920 [Candidatus Kerfeldbacteria bacterium CG15_BIG_FIL_POST_REV_8_21_14_020_45_12]|uniref:PEP-utilising enzyme mobile domain-containing protein n=1 Tax=Candidatus Kerfeldbacteria bacterium CG15_BIG_FIL_POST_REV_8_21_14_020_45_12 TaxID=2014247 RepID=A0A2M7H4E0_9BACT|nr:MAG: hypothetical protein COW24_01920 [Candidatus Kerfeldbacteria bacterium CG15_BIG_FIL_POST_REV_8_21_14_020_45_12]PJA93092.1 MAG: hypothetical protein CO132_04920 [Candidatus Kerfeldbacteria bacterium CG_4_9_14_3_um_filter_45_8]
MVEASTRAFYGVMMSPEKRSEIAKSYDAVVGELRAYAKLVYRDGVSDLTDEVLIEQFASWREQVMDFWAWASPGECATFGGEEEIRLAVEANWSGREVAEIMEVLTAPIALSFFQDAELNLLERVLECENESQALQEHVTNFYWLDNGYYGSRRRTEIEAKKMLDSLLEDHGSLQEAIDSIRNYEQALFSRRAALKEKYKIDDDLMKKSLALGDAVSWQDARKAEQFVYTDVLMEFLKEFARRFNHEIEDLYWLRTNEVLENIKDPKAIKSLVDKRRPLCAMVASRDGVELWDGKRGQEFVRQFWDSNEEHGDMQGIVASFGKQSERVVTGLVRVVLDPHVIDHFIDGEVLVAPMTSPDYMPLMRRASAIITDEGGLTAHAAVVSRELGIPCIVGAKTASKQLTTGDRVILDLDNGQIRIDS